MPYEELDEWRRNFGGVRHLHEATGMLVTGAIDDLWINKNDEYRHHTMKCHSMLLSRVHGETNIKTKTINGA